MAGSMALLVFAVCLGVGLLQADNPFATTVLRALGAMVVTFIVGLLVGAMGSKMLDENVKQLGEKSQESTLTAGPNDR